MEYRFTRIIKTFIYINFNKFYFRNNSFILKFDDDKTLIELHSSKVIFPLFVPFLIGTVCLYSSRRKKCFKILYPCDFVYRFVAFILF